jgi:hypothetical protein
MTHASDTAHAPTSSGAAMLPAIASIILTVIWGAYTALFAVEVLSIPLPS